jgi:hypothetical protein
VLAGEKPRGRRGHDTAADDRNVGGPLPFVRIGDVLTGHAESCGVGVAPDKGNAGRNGPEAKVRRVRCWSEARRFAEP